MESIAGIEISDNGVTRVETSDDPAWIIKKQTKKCCDREMYFLCLLAPRGITPGVIRLSKKKLKIEFIQAYPFTSIDQLRSSFVWTLRALNDLGVRHGDLTEKNIIIVQHNRIKLIDFSESLSVFSLRTDKRPEGDKYWMRRTFKKLTGQSL